MTSARHAQLPDELILVRIEDRSEGGQVAYVTVNNEAKHNALPVEGRSLLAKTMRDVSRNPELRCVVLTGAGSKSFIGGANISEMSEFPDPHIAESGSATTHAACDSIRRVPVPVIARIDGYCLGADSIKAHTDDGDFVGVLDRGAGNWKESTKLTFSGQK